MKVYVMVLKGTKNIETEIAQSMTYIFKSKQAAKRVLIDSGIDFYDVREAELKIGKLLK